ncbi:mycothiol synthase [Haloechinothrix halophila]|uniref:mycothiol synthase n=1 Tax=Haloechinothrix halophila TaxID=1069073 RepID=UPI0004234AB4|nr:mycothiol synthase [Haloechinothrix halophila]
MLTPHWFDTLDDARTEDVRALLLAARAADGWPSITTTGPLPGEFAGGRHLLGYLDDGLIGYAHLDTDGDAFGRQVIELIVHPEHRNRGHGSALFDVVLDAVRAAGGSTVRVWSHADHPDAAKLADRAGCTRVRELLIMSAAASDLRLTDPVLPDGVRLRTFRPGQDEQAVIDVNARAFVWHPEQGAMTVEDLVAAERENWFDANGFFLAERAGDAAVDAAASSDVALLGFHWTKVHPPGPEPGSEPVGEVYVVGVDPAAQGSGVGTALTIAGLVYLREQGLPTVILYVEGDNPAAIAVYRKLGFDTESTAVQYER